MCKTEKSFIKPSSSIYNLSRLFIATASYYNLTKQQALVNKKLKKKVFLVGYLFRKQK